MRWQKNEKAEKCDGKKMRWQKNGVRAVGVGKLLD
jgi:hypothetical protein